MNAFSDCECVHRYRTCLLYTSIVLCSYLPYVFGLMLYFIDWKSMYHTMVAHEVNINNIIMFRLSTKKTMGREYWPWRFCRKRRRRNNRPRARPDWSCDRRPWRIWSGRRAAGPFWATVCPAVLPDFVHPCLVWTGTRHPENMDLHFCKTLPASANSITFSFLIYEFVINKKQPLL